MRERETITCVIADDHPAILQSVSEKLRSDGVKVVGLATDGEEALRLILEREPQVALLDIHMPGMTGIEVARTLSNTLNNATRVIFYTAHGEIALLHEALDVGAKGFLRKEGPLSELREAVRRVARGESYVDPTLSPALFNAQVVEKLPNITKQERAVLRLLAHGHTNEEAAKELFLSPDTVRSHVRNSMRKLEASTRTEAVAIAMRMELIN